MAGAEFVGASAAEAVRAKKKAAAQTKLEHRNPHLRDPKKVHHPKSEDFVFPGASQYLRIFPVPSGRLPDGTGW
jgi:hypothetical protein